MALTADSLATLAFTDHVANFPDAASVTLQHDTLGPFNPSQEMIKALCAGLVNALDSVAINARYEGDAGKGTAVPVPISISEAILQLAISTFMSDQEWTGDQAALAADSLVGAPIRRLMTLGVLQVEDTNYVGEAFVDPEANPELLGVMQGALNTTLPEAFTASGYFGDPVNPQLAEQLTYYAAAYATAIASVTASVDFTGDTGSSTVEGVVPGFLV